MKPTDLRLGNYIDKYGKPTKVDLGILQKIENGSVIYKPIPLTEEWLKKLGLLYNPEDPGFIPFWYREDFKIHKRLDGFIYNQTKIYSVHQLQNLFYAIVGDELTITD